MQSGPQTGTRVVSTTGHPTGTRKTGRPSLYTHVLGDHPRYHSTRAPSAWGKTGAADTTNSAMAREEVLHQERVAFFDRAAPARMPGSYPGAHISSQDD